MVGKISMMNMTKGSLDTMDMDMDTLDILPNNILLDSTLHHLEHTLLHNMVIPPRVIPPRATLRPDTLLVDTLLLLIPAHLVIIQVRLVLSSFEWPCFTYVFEESPSRPHIC